MLWMDVLYPYPKHWHTVYNLVSAVEADGVLYANRKKVWEYD